MLDVNNPHDAFARELLSRPEVAADFLVNYPPPKLAEAIDPATVAMRKDSFVDEELREHFSDLVYEVGFKGGGAARIVVLIDHKSDPEKWVGLQLLRYELRLWQDAKNAKAERLPVVIPVVLYHGRKRWRVPQRFGGLFAPAEMKLAREFVPDFKYHLCDLSSFRDEELKGGAELRAGLLLLKNIFNRRLKDPLVAVFRLVRELPQWRRNEYLNIIRIYLRAAKAKLHREEVLDALKESFDEEAGGFMETYADSWIEEGKQIGLQQGLQQGLAKAVINYLEWRFGSLDEETKRRVRAQSPETLDRLDQTMFAFNNLHDLAEWMKKEAV